MAVNNNLPINVNNQPISEEKSLQAEYSVLGSLLIDADEIAPALFATVKPDEFQFDRNREIFLAARKLFRENSPVDAVTVFDALNTSPGESEYMSKYIAQLVEITPTSANWKEYAAIMREESLLAKIHSLGAELFFAKSLDDCRPTVAALSDVLSNQSGVKVYSGSDLLASFLDYLEEACENPESGAAYIRYGLPALDEGMFTELGDVVVIGGYPSDGKTAWSLNLAWQMSQKFKVGFFSLETNHKKIRDRWVSHALPFDFDKIKRVRYQNLSQEDWDKVAKQTTAVCKFGNGKAAKENFRVIEAAGMSASDIQSVSRAWGFQVIFIDYIQEVSPDSVRRYGTRNDELAAISRSMHVFAQSTKTAIFELSQLTRSQTGNPKKRDPHMDSLRESGQLEQDADAVFLLFRENPDDLKTTQRILRIAKNKEGRLGKFYLDFDPSTQTFSLSANNAARDYAAQGRAVKQFNRTYDNANAYDNPPSLFESADADDNSDLPF